MLERFDVMDADLAARLRTHEVPGPPTLYPHRGSHSSPRRGASLEFSEHREYSPGEDTRDLDWKLFARTDRYHLKRYEDERLQRASFLLDASASMSFGAEVDAGLKGSKYHYAARIVWALSTLLLHQGDAVGLGTAGGRRPSVFLPPRSGQGQSEAITEILSGTEPGDEATLPHAVNAVGEQLKGTAALFVVSDFLDSPDADLETIQMLRGRGIRPRLVHVLHRDEVELAYDSTTRFIDMEGPDSITLDPESVRRAYSEEIRDFVRYVSNAAEERGIPYVFLTADEDPVPALQALIWQVKRA